MSNQSLNQSLEHDDAVVTFERSATNPSDRLIRDRKQALPLPIGNTLCWLERVLYRLVIVPMITFLPARFAYGVACLRGDLRYRMDTRMRELIIRNLADVLGERLNPAERGRVVRDFFRRQSCEAVDVTRLAGKGNALKRLIEIQGLEHLEAALASGKGVILCSAHFGQASGAECLLGALGFPVTGVGNWAATDDPTMSRLEQTVHWLFRNQFLARHQRGSIEPGKAGAMTAVEIARVLRANEIITLAIDAPLLDPKDRARAVAVDFLGHQATLLAGSTHIAQRTGAQVLVEVVRRSPDWRHQVMEISGPIEITDDPVAAFKRCVAMVEAPIREEPHYWDFWEARQVLVNMGLISGQVLKSPVYWDTHPDRLPATPLH